MPKVISIKSESSSEEEEDPNAVDLFAADERLEE